MVRVAPRRISISMAAVFATIAMALATAPAQADILWKWSFAEEGGTFVTDGDLVGGDAPAGRYTVDPATFTVLTSSMPGLLGTGYTANQPPQGLIWDGLQPTELWRADGAFDWSHNGMNHFRPDYWYGLDVSGGRLYDDTGDDYFVMLTGPLTLQPLSTVTVPVPASLGLVVVGLLSLRRLRRR